MLDRYQRPSDEVLAALTANNLRFVKEIFATRHTPEQMLAGATGYEWTADLENRRLHLQNRRGEWPKGHQEYLQRLQETGFEIKTAVIVGTDAEGVFVNHYQCFPNLQTVNVVEQDIKKLIEAQKRGKRSNDSNNKVTYNYYTGDAAHILPKLGQVDAVDINLVLQHCVDKAPGFLSPPAQENFTTLPKLLLAVANGLTGKGIVVVNDLAMTEWMTVAAPGSENDPKVQQKIAEANTYIKRALIASYQARTAHAWNGPGEIRETIQNQSNGRLVAIDNLNSSLAIPTDQLQETTKAQSSLIAATIAQGAERSLGAYQQALKQNPDNSLLQGAVEKLTGAAEYLWAAGARYVDIIADPRVFVTTPTMHYLTFQKAG